MAYKGPVREPASVLTNAQRKHLREDQPDVEGAAKRAMEARIRERAREALLDLSLLYENYDDLGLESIFESEDYDQPGLGRCIQDTTGLFYRGAFDTRIPFDKSVELGCHRAERAENDRMVGFNLVQTQSEKPTTMMQVAAKKVENDEIYDLTPGQMESVLRALAHSDADIRGPVQEGTISWFDIDDAENTDSSDEEK